AERGGLRREPERLRLTDDRRAVAAERPARELRAVGDGLRRTLGRIEDELLPEATPEQVDARRSPPVRELLDDRDQPEADRLLGDLEGVRHRRVRRELRERELDHASG